MLRSKTNCFVPIRHSPPRAKALRWAALKNAVPAPDLIVAEKVPRWVPALLVIVPPQMPVLPVKLAHPVKLAPQAITAPPLTPASPLNVLQESAPLPLLLLIVTVVPSAVAAQAAPALSLKNSPKRSSQRRYSQRRSPLGLLLFRETTGITF